MKDHLQLFDMTAEELENCMTVDDLKVIRLLILEMATDLIVVCPPEQHKKVGLMVDCVQKAVRIIDNTIKLQDQVAVALEAKDALQEAAQATKQ